LRLPLEQLGRRDLQPVGDPEDLFEAGAVRVVLDAVDRLAVDAGELGGPLLRRAPQFA